jgi:hypothetical protein
MLLLMNGFGLSSTKKFCWRRSLFDLTNSADKWGLIDLFRGPENSGIRKKSIKWPISGAYAACAPDIYCIGLWILIKIFLFLSYSHFSKQNYVVFPKRGLPYVTQSLGTELALCMTDSHVPCMDLFHFANPDGNKVKWCHKQVIQDTH